MSLPNSLMDQRAIERKRQRQREYYAKNPDKYKDKRRAYVAKNKEKISAHMAAYYQKHKERIRKRIGVYRAANIESYRERARRWRRKQEGLPDATRPEPSVCECCGSPAGWKGRLHLDHCHETGKFRGWLCKNCNVGLGLLGDNEANLIRALEYLRRAWTS